ncbi:MAG: CZB domain-containing protein, partial [Rhodospirillales bacterium]|nr:CZB domain-containing protein [Rhodospirillales bacterium]
MAVGVVPERYNGDRRRDRAAMDLPKITLYRVLSDHFHWKKELAEVLIGRRRMPAREFGNPDDCGLGKWCNSISKSGYGDSPDFAKLRDPHDRVHLHAERAVIHLRNGNRIGALAEFDRV